MRDLQKDLEELKKLISNARMLRVYTRAVVQHLISTRNCWHYEDKLVIQKNETLDEKVTEFFGTIFNAQISAFDVIDLEPLENKMIVEVDLHISLQKARPFSVDGPEGLLALMAFNGLFIEDLESIINPISLKDKIRGNATNLGEMASSAGSSIAEKASGIFAGLRNKKE